MLLLLCMCTSNLWSALLPSTGTLATFCHPTPSAYQPLGFCEYLALLHTFNLVASASHCCILPVFRGKGPSVVTDTT